MASKKKLQLNQVCYRSLNLGVEKPWSLEAYESMGGYSVLKKILKEKNSPGKNYRRLKGIGSKGAWWSRIFYRFEMELYTKKP